MIVFVFIAAATAFGVLALRFGAESRPGFDERRESHDIRSGLL